MTVLTHFVVDVHFAHKYTYSYVAALNLWGGYMLLLALLLGSIFHALKRPQPQ